MTNLYAFRQNDFRAQHLIRHVGVTNISSVLIENHPPPEFVISVRGKNIVEGIEYKEVWKKTTSEFCRKIEFESNFQKGYNSN